MTTPYYSSSPMNYGYFNGYFPSHYITTAAFPDWTANDAREAIAVQTGWFVKPNRLFLEGDHWQQGFGWIGPQPDVREVGYFDTMRAIELAFTSRNVIAEVLDRHKNGVIGREPRWRCTPKRFLAPGETPNETELKDIAQIEEWLTLWWDKKKVISILQQATRNVLFAERGPVRLYIPKGLLDYSGTLTGVTIKNGDIATALEYLWAEAPDPESATVYCDPYTKRELGVVVECYPNGAESYHLTFLDKGSGDPERTIWKLINYASSGVSTPTELDYNFGGRIPVAEIRRHRLINDQILQGQRALNLALSMIPRTVVTAGFLERVLLNAQMPGEFVDVKDAQGHVTGKRFVPSPPVFGAGTTNYVAPLAVDEEDGHGGTRTVMSRADVKWREPVDPQAAVGAKLAHYQDILEEANQAHILITSDATPSGNSREQARAEYEASLNETKPHVDAVGRWLLETVVAMAEELAGVPGKYTDNYRFLFECNVDTGPLTADERRQHYEAADKGYLSAQGAMELAGVEDVDAEQARIKAEGAGAIGTMVQRATALKLLADAQFPIAVAIKLLNIPEGLQGEVMSEVQKQQDLQLQQQQMAQDHAMALAKVGGPPGAPGGKPKPVGKPSGGKPIPARASARPKTALR